MNRIYFIVLVGILATSLLTGCKDETATPTVSAQSIPVQPMPAQQRAPGAQGRAGTVVETMDSGGYTYIQVDTGAETFWAAAPQFAVKIGDKVVVPEGMAMPNHHSRTLNRDFDLIYFVNGVQVGDAPAVASSQLPAGHPQVQSEAPPMGRIDAGDLEKAEGGLRISEVFAKKDDLAGQKVTIRGKVVKYNGGIMGKNWLHLQDGTGESGQDDLTVTTDATARVGETIVITGKVATNKDFGFGYNYDVLIEDAVITVE